MGNMIFLLGGHDLEMVEIARVLKLPGLKFYDKDLSWSEACLSRYSDVLNDDDYFVGIELKNDITEPAHYRLIDHHNHLAKSPSSLEQVASLLGIELNREQQLIAANDRGYIPAMEAMGASKEEIENIRFRDRQAQGATAEDERLAERSVRENLSVIGGITVIKSLTPRFSTITDRLYPCGRLLIYNEESITYYGDGISVLAQHFEDQVKQGIAYYGSGFFGLTVEAIKQAGGIEKLLNAIISKVSG